MSSVRLADVARAAHVSVSAVSKALADSPEISPETKIRIRTVAKEMGYHSNTLARSLRLGKSTLLGVIVPNNDNPYYSSILQGIAEKARKRNYTIIIATSNENGKDEISAIHSLLSVPVAGILSVPVNIENYLEVKLPLVFLSRFPYRHLSAPHNQPLAASRFSYVVNDDFEGQRLATEVLTRQGVSDIFLLLDTDDHTNVSSFKTFARLDGYKQALLESGIPYLPERVHFRINSIESCFNVVTDICKQHASLHTPIGICVTNDHLSIGALNALRESGLSVPDHARIVGYDDIEMARYFSPPLTTVHVANKELGRLGSVHLFDMIDEKFDSKQNISTVLQPYLEIRQST